MLSLYLFMANDFIEDLVYGCGISLANAQELPWSHAKSSKYEIMCKSFSGFNVTQTESVTTTFV